MSVGDPQLAGKLSPIVNIKDFGATCNGSTNDLSALEAAVTAGHKRIFCPSNTLILLNGSGSWAANTIAGGLQIFGEDWTTVVFKSNSVSSTEVYAGAGTELNNVAIYSYRGEVIKTDMPGGVNQARPVRKYANNTNSTRAVQTWYK
ncbi:MAG: hypothetical protein KKF27_21730, partial [Gammaproteobacteria bacterium]|nr:hypothetical protein [Gammaproteobacteria bacterium]MBU2685871.1 hypothetical protein [Gammaproteobacteria bacterium]